MIIWNAAGEGGHMITERHVKSLYYPQRWATEFFDSNIYSASLHFLTFSRKPYGNTSLLTFQPNKPDKTRKINESILVITFQIFQKRNKQQRKINLLISFLFHHYERMWRWRWWIFHGLLHPLHKIGHVGIHRKIPSPTTTSPANHTSQKVGGAKQRHQWAAIISTATLLASFQTACFQWGWTWLSGSTWSSGGWGLASCGGQGKPGHLESYHCPLLSSCPSQTQCGNVVATAPALQNL